MTEERHLCEFGSYREDFEDVNQWTNVDGWSNRRKKKHVFKKYVPRSVFAYVLPQSSNESMDNVNERLSLMRKRIPSDYLNLLMVGYCTELEHLIILEAIKEHFNISRVSFQDPLITNSERAYLKSRGVQVLPADDLLSPPPKPYGRLTLLYMPHCERTMYDNILSTYSSNENSPKSIVLFGNNPRSIMEQPSSSRFPFICSFAEKCQNIFVSGFDNSDTFSNTSISFL